MTMIVTVRRGADADAVRRGLAAAGLWVDRFDAGDRTSFHVAVSSARVERERLLAIDGVESVAEAVCPHPLVREAGAVAAVSGCSIGSGAPAVLAAGPCSVESEAQIDRIAAAVAGAGARFLRGGAFKPRTSPYAFRGHGLEALRWMRRAADRHGLLVVSEAMGSEEAPLVAELADLVQIGSRNMHNYALLATVGSLGRPVLLKRGMAATVEEWLGAGEYLLLHGAPSVVFCERGVRSFEPTSRNVLDLNAVALLAHVARVPVIVDPSHAAGRRDLIPHLARAAIAAGAHGLIVECHDDPGSALSDGPQALSLPALSELFREIGGPR
jgi:3-deoxy-7-phosphoheptulonate synthase